MLKKRELNIIISAVLFLVSLFGLFVSERFTRQEEPEAKTYLVTEVVDGDTFKVIINGDEETVRLVGVDTPETQHPQVGVECFGKEAKEELTKLLRDQTVYTEYDTEQPEKDRYGRLLLYVWLGSKDGLFINEYLVKNGFAEAYRSAPSQFLEEFIEFEDEAREGRKGLWGDTCN